jgi:transposase
MGDFSWRFLSEGKVIVGKYRKFTAEYREEAVKMVIESSRPTAEVARDLGLNESTLGNWVTKYRAEHPASEDLNISERARLKELEKENRELRLEREFLKKAAAFFAKEQ